MLPRYERKVNRVIAKHPFLTSAQIFEKTWIKGAKQ